MRQTFANDADSIQWLRETHLAPKWTLHPIPEFASYILHGNEDCPNRLELYRDVDPLYTNEPIAIFVYDSETGQYRPEE